MKLMRFSGWLGWKEKKTRQNGLQDRWKNVKLGHLILCFQLLVFLHLPPYLGKCAAFTSLSTCIFMDCACGICLRKRLIFQVSAYHSRETKQRTKSWRMLETTVAMRMQDPLRVEKSWEKYWAFHWGME